MRAFAQTIWLGGMLGVVEATEGTGAAETAFRWLNFLLVVAALGYLLWRYALPWFRGRADAMAEEIARAQQALAAARRQLEQAEQKWSSLEHEAEHWRQRARQATQAEVERMRQLTTQEVTRIEQAAEAEIAAAQQAARLQLRQLLVERTLAHAEERIRQSWTLAADQRWFQRFLQELAEQTP